MHMLLGNHEYMMINAIDDPGYQINQWFTNLDLWYLNGGAITEMAYNELDAEKQNEIISYIRQLPLNIEVTCNGKQYLLVHGSPASMYKKESIRSSMPFGTALIHRKMSSIQKRLLYVATHRPFTYRLKYQWRSFTRETFCILTVGAPIRPARVAD